MTLMVGPELFQSLDVDGDGFLSRSDLHEAARHLGWGWREAPFYAVLDFLCLGAPLSEDGFQACVEQIARDRHGVYGEVLTRVSPWQADHTSLPANPETDVSIPGSDRSEAFISMVSILEEALGKQVGTTFLSAAEELCTNDYSLPLQETAALLIDPQRSFTSGAWMHSIGPDAETEVRPLERAFANCADWLRVTHGRIEFMVTRCPFPPDSYGWDPRVDDVLDENQPYFVKPGNSVLWPPTNGFAQWVESMIGRGKSNLVMGGCTLNSCVRVSAIETQRRFGESGLQVVVDLSLCGARTSNFLPSAEFGGMSSVESAVREMVSEGVTVVPHVEWLA